MLIFNYIIHLSFFMKKTLLYFIIFILTFTNAFAITDWQKELNQAKENTNKLLEIFSLDMLINIVFAIFAILITIVISKIVNLKIKKFIEKWWEGENREELSWVISRTANISILAIWFTVVLGILGIDMWIFLWWLWFWIWFTLKIFLSNFIAWIIMVTQWSYHNWDIIELNSRIWKIRKINSLFTEVEQFDGVVFFIPNVKFLEEEVKNFNINDKRRITIEIWVEYETDIVQAKKIMLQVVNNFPYILKTPKSNVFIDKFDENWIKLNLQFWINSQWNIFETKSNVTETINLAFKKYWIKIPYKQITLSNRSNFKIDLNK